MEIRRVGLCLKAGQPQTADLIRELVKWLEARGLEVLADDEAARLAGTPPRTREETCAAADLVVALGGDGTLLSVARAAGSRPVPILGVNLGTLGFLTAVTREEVLPALERVLAGRVAVESRMRLEVEAFRGGRSCGPRLALNDAVITNETLARMINLEALADGVPVTTYHADGLIVATPTGSTAYSLSAGGPILSPRLEAMLLTPICPHTLTHRPLVLPSTAVVEIRVLEPGEHVQLTVDGQDRLPLREGDRVLVRRAASPVLLVASPFRDPFEILRQKLTWGRR